MKRPVGICRVLCMGLVLVGLIAGCDEKQNSSNTDGKTTWALSSEGDGWCTYKYGQFTTSKEAPAAGCANSIVVGASGEE